MITKVTRIMKIIDTPRKAENEEEVNNNADNDEILHCII